MFVVAAPDGQGGSPETIARKGPVDVVIEPITISSFFDCLWMPICFCILTKQRIFDRCSSDVPGRLCVIHQRCVAAPTMWVGVFVLLMLI